MTYVQFIESEKDFRKIFDEYYVALCMFAERFIGNSGASADIVQDCFVSLWQQRANFNGIRPAKAFLYTSVRNRALNELNHLRIVREYESSVQEKRQESFFHDHVIEQELYRILSKEILKLPEQSRKVMMLALQGYKTAEIAERLWMAEGTVQTHKKLAYKRLRNTLGNKSMDSLLCMLLFF